MEEEKRITVTSKHQVTLPVTMCKELGIHKGDQLAITYVNNEIRIRRVPQFAPLTKESSLFRFVGIAEGPGGPGARNHDQIIADEAASSKAGDA